MRKGFEKFNRDREELYSGIQLPLSQELFGECYDRPVSYELFFRSRSGGRQINNGAFAEYFSNRPRYKLQGSRGVYLNDDTNIGSGISIAQKRKLNSVSTSLWRV